MVFTPDDGMEGVILFLSRPSGRVGLADLTKGTGKMILNRHLDNTDARPLWGCNDIGKNGTSSIHLNRGGRGNFLWLARSNNLMVCEGESKGYL